MDDQLCYLNGDFVPLTEARIHPLDRGFTFGDGIYEVVKVRDGKLLFLDEHLRRLEDGLEAVRIPAPAGVRQAALELVERSGVRQGSLFIEITRGVAPRVHVPPEDLVPTRFMLAGPHEFQAPGGPGMTAISRPDWRWGRCDIKSVSLMATVLGKLELRGASASEVIFRGPRGELREGGSTNLFVRHGDRWETHPLGSRVLPGVTRTLLTELATRLGQPVVESSPRLAEREEWREALLCGTLTGVQGLVELDGEPIGPGTVGPWTRDLAHAFDRMEAERADSSTPSRADAR